MVNRYGNHSLMQVKEIKFKTFKNVCARHVAADIERSRSYHLIDEKQSEVDKSDVIDGNRYGSTIVPFSFDDQEAMKLRTEKCFKVLGFTKYDNVKRYQYFGDSMSVCLSEKGNEAGHLYLSALIRALFETSMVAIVRRVYNNNGQVKIGCLIPHIKDKYECMFYVDLPFAEDLRQYTFASLPVGPNVQANKMFQCTGEFADVSLTLFAIIIREVVGTMTFMLLDR
ncbi:hypothetical protein HELRODRAFT_181143 [Helobdella robusta]|uniref:Ku domain-containing protein n=1 Tax=Helobdella robusta TaxID=6412 RepID=T1FGN7_HELRO|nr:hypothetical protein HELRODRAFT_181143 [Helobdella robusta]ESN93216.1 hypothetical protein HELRODRAFT_181143 [Helobdella robusta]